MLGTGIWNLGHVNYEVLGAGYGDLEPGARKLRGFRFRVSRLGFRLRGFGGIRDPPPWVCSKMAFWGSNALKYEGLADWSEQSPREGIRGGIINPPFARVILHATLKGRRIYHGPSAACISRLYSASVQLTYGPYMVFE